MWGLLGLKLCLEARGDAPEELPRCTTEDLLRLIASNYTNCFIFLEDIFTLYATKESRSRSTKISKT